MNMEIDESPRDFLKPATTPEQAYIDSMARNIDDLELELAIELDYTKDLLKYQQQMIDRINDHKQDKHFFMFFSELVNKLMHEALINYNHAKTEIHKTSKEKSDPSIDDSEPIKLLQTKIMKELSIIKTLEAEKDKLSLQLFMFHEMWKTLFKKNRGWARDTNEMLLTKVRGTYSNQLNVMLRLYCDEIGECISNIQKKFRKKTELETLEHNVGTSSPVAAVANAQFPEQLKEPIETLQWKLRETQINLESIRSTKTALECKLFDEIGKNKDIEAHNGILNELLKGYKSELEQIKLLSENLRRRTAISMLDRDRTNYQLEQTFEESRQSNIQHKKKIDLLQARLAFNKWHGVKLKTSCELINADLMLYRDLWAKEFKKARGWTELTDEEFRKKVCGTYENTTDVLLYLYRKETESKLNELNGVK